MFLACFSVFIRMRVNRSLHFVTSFMVVVSSVRIIAIPPLPFVFPSLFSFSVFGAGVFYIAYDPIPISVALVSFVSCIHDISTSPRSSR